MMRILILLILLNSLVFAQAEAEKKEGKETTYTQKQLDEKVDETVKKKLKMVVPSNLTNFAKELLKKEKEIEQKESELKKQEEAFQLNKKSFSKRILEFQSQQQEILGCLDKNKNQEKERVDHIVQVISGMKPVKASELLSTQDPDISVKILGLLEAERASKIFNLMDKEVSALLQKQYLHMKR